MGVAYTAGDVVAVRRGKYIGIPFVVVGAEDEKRILIADGRNYKAASPKRKNPVHLRKALINLKDVGVRIAGGKCLDNGWLARQISLIPDECVASLRYGG